MHWDFNYHPHLLMCIYSTARAHCVSHFVACLVPLSLFKSHANLFVLIVLIVLYCCGLFYVSLCVSCCPCHCVREAFVVVCDLCCLFMLKLFVCLWFGASAKINSSFNLVTCHCLFLFSGSFSVETTAVPVVFLYQFLFLLLLLLCFNQKPLSCLSMPRRFC